jgi:hypothetical protein
MSAAPNVNNYSILRGTFTFTPTGGSAIVLGDVRDCTYTPAVTKLDHFSHQAGIRIKDRSVVVELGASMKLTLDEINDANMAMFLLGDTQTSGSIGGLTNPDLSGVLTMTGTNAVGTKVSFTGKVNLLPAGDLAMVADTAAWAGLPISAEVLLDSGAYGVWTLTDQVP